MKRLSRRGSIGQIGEFQAGPRHCCMLKAPIAITVTCNMTACRWEDGQNAVKRPIIGCEVPA